MKVAWMVLHLATKFASSLSQETWNRGNDGAVHDLVNAGHACRQCTRIADSSTNHHSCQQTSFFDIPL